MIFCSVIVEFLIPTFDSRLTRLGCVLGEWFTDDLCSAVTGVALLFKSVAWLFFKVYGKILNPYAS